MQEPDHAITREEMAKVLAKAIGEEILTVLAAEAAPKAFADSAEFADWSKTSIESLAALGIINGYEDGTFKADKAITRAEVAVLIDRVSTMFNLK